MKMAFSFSLCWMGIGLKADGFPPVWSSFEWWQKTSSSLGTEACRPLCHVCTANKLCSNEPEIQHRHLTCSANNTDTYLEPQILNCSCKTHLQNVLLLSVLLICKDTTAGRAFGSSEQSLAQLTPARSVSMSAHRRYFSAVWFYGA